MAFLCNTGCNSRSFPTKAARQKHFDETGHGVENLGTPVGSAKKAKRSTRKATQAPARNVKALKVVLGQLDERTAACVRRLGVSVDVAARIVNRDIPTCQGVVESLKAEWDAAQPGSCCKPTAKDQLACEHLIRLWQARDYLALAKAKAPTCGAAYPCKCGGTGIFDGNGGPCYGCTAPKSGASVGKGWQDADDFRRNGTYWKYRRLSA